MAKFDLVKSTERSSLIHFLQLAPELIIGSPLLSLWLLLLLLLIIGVTLKIKLAHLD